VLKHLVDGVEAIAVMGECSDADPVVDLVDEQRADLLITDIRMPPSRWSSTPPVQPPSNSSALTIGRDAGAGWSCSLQGRLRR